MLIIYPTRGATNGTEIEDFNSTLLERHITPMTFLPNTLPKRPAYKSIMLKILVRGDNEFEISQTISRLTAMLQNCEIGFKDMGTVRTPVEVTGSITPEKVNNTAYTLEYNFIGEMSYTFRPKKFGGTGQELEYNNNGTWDSPFKMKVSIMKETPILNITVGDTSMGFKDLKMGNVLIIDTLETKITLNGQPNIDKMTTSVFPTLPVGLGRITFSSEVHAQVEYREMWI